ncbi:MAG: ABC transporter permease [Anaerolineaceae bacterium]|nr:ABC transporter permease [Anaerolineaceae bacterium]
MADLLSQFAFIFTSLDFYAAVFRLTTPILLVAMGSIFCERAGIMNIATEGFMLMGAMTAVVVTYYLGSPWLGALGAMLAAMVLSLLFAVFVVIIGTDHIVTAVALNVFSLGTTSLIFRQIFGAMSRTPDITGLPIWRLPLLGDLPVLGNILFNQSPLVYLAFLSVPIANFFMFRTKWGLNIRAVGETPRAADTVGLNVYRIRIYTILVSGLVAGLAGAFLSIGQTTIFQEGMTAGRGYIAYTAIVFGKWNPLGALVGAVIFGFADALQLRIQALGMGIPYQFALMIPYLFTVLAIVFAVGRVSWSAAYGQPYRRVERSVD